MDTGTLGLQHFQYGNTRSTQILEVVKAWRVRLSVTNLSLENNLLTFQLNVQITLLFHLSRSKLIMRSH